MTGSIVRDLELGLKELKPGQESLSDCCCRSKHVVSLPLHRQSSLPCYHFSMFYLQTSVAPHPICFVTSLSACPTDSKGAKWNDKCKNQVFQALVRSGLWIIFVVVKNWYGCCDYIATARWQLVKAQWSVPQDCQSEYMVTILSDDCQFCLKAR